MIDYDNPEAFDVKFVIQQDPKTEKWSKTIWFNGSIDLGKFNGKLEADNPTLNRNEMRGIIYRLVFEQVEKALSPCLPPHW